MTASVVTGHPPHAVAPRVATVSSRAEFNARFNIEGVRFVETEYRFGGFEGLLETINRAVFGRKLQHFQVLFEELEDATEEQPIVVYVRNGDAAAREFGPDLIHFMCFWERYAFECAEPSPMFLILELRSQQR